MKSRVFQMEWQSNRQAERGAMLRRRTNALRSLARIMGSFHFNLKRIGTMNHSCRREPAGEAGFANHPHAFTGVATSRFMEIRECLIG